MGARKGSGGRRGLLALLLGALLLFGGCEARPGTNVSPKEQPGSSASSQQEKKKKQDKAEESGKDEPEDAPPEKAKASSSAPVIDPESEAQRLLDARIGTLCFYYTGNFGVSDTLNPAQIYWSVFKWYSSGPDYQPPAKPDYTGYEQLDAKTVKKLAEQWYGPDIPDYEGNPSALGDPATGELINVSENGDTYYFLEVEMPMEETHLLQSARVDDDGTLTVRFNAQDSGGGYLRTYLCKLQPDAKGNYYLVSLNKGQT